MLTFKFEVSFLEAKSQRIALQKGRGFEPVRVAQKKKGKEGNETQWCYGVKVEPLKYDASNFALRSQFTHKRAAKAI